MSDGARIDYSIAGAPSAPPLLFINSIATTRELWARQVPRLSKSFRVITYDDILNSTHEFAPGVNTLTMDGPAPLLADPDGRYPVPMPGLVTDREYGTPPAPVTSAAAQRG